MACDLLHPCRRHSRSAFPSPFPRFHHREFDTRFLQCRCPTTQREYLLPVPNNVITCRQAAAWMAGFDNPDDYAPIQET